MEQDQADNRIRDQVTIMVITTAVEFAAGFGLLALLIFGLWDIVDGSISARKLLAFLLSGMLTLWTGYRAMHLVVRPEWRGLAIVLLSGIAALVPIFTLDF